MAREKHRWGITDIILFVSIYTSMSILFIMFTPELWTMYVQNIGRNGEYLFLTCLIFWVLLGTYATCMIYYQAYVISKRIEKQPPQLQSPTSDKPQITVPNTTEINATTDEEKRFDKESVYDNEISPLMKQIIEICKREKIPMAFDFAIKDDGEEDGWLFCTTVHDHKMDSEVPYVETIEKARALFYPPKPLFMAMRIGSSDKNER